MAWWIWRRRKAWQLCGGGGVWAILQGLPQRQEVGVDRGCQAFLDGFRKQVDGEKCGDGEQVRLVALEVFQGAAQAFLDQGDLGV